MEEVKTMTISQSPIKVTGDKAVLFKAYCAAQNSMGDVIKTATNPAFRSKYADLSAVVEAVTPKFNENGFAVIQSPTYDKSQSLVVIDLLLGHESGGCLEFQLVIPVTKQDAQGIGSAITYGRRYQLLAVSGTAPEDDDGNAASEKTKQEAPTKPTKPKVMIDHLQTIEEIEAISDLSILSQVWTACYRNRDNYTPEGFELLTQAKDKQKAQLQALDDEIPH